uniref:Uncharacterized protein n=1 Tax=Ditylenchus dipsaci TaxID=166011 RepID=A0A915EUP5_9BILA
MQALVGAFEGSNVQPPKAIKAPKVNIQNSTHPVSKLPKPEIGKEQPRISADTKNKKHQEKPALIPQKSAKAKDSHIKVEQKSEKVQEVHAKRKSKNNPSAKAKWSIIVLKCVVRTYYRLKKFQVAAKEKKLAQTADEKWKESVFLGTMKKFEEYAMKTVENELTVNIGDFLQQPEVDLHEFTELEPHSDLKKVGVVCEKPDAKHQNMCSMVYLMVLALEDIVVGENSIIIAFLNEGSNIWLDETARKLQKMYKDEVTNKHAELKTRNGTLSRLLNCNWAIQLLSQLEENTTI